MKSIIRKILLSVAITVTTTVAAQEVIVATAPADTAHTTELQATTVAKPEKAVKTVKKSRKHIVLGEELPHDTIGKRHNRGLTQHLIIPKGELQLGAQLSHVSLASNNSEFMLLLNGLNANGSMTKIAPFFAYSYKNNRSIGIRVQYSTASANIKEGALDLLSDDLSFSFEDLRADISSIQTSIYHRSYLGLDNKGRIGVFADIALSYANSKNIFSYDTTTQNTYARTHQLKLSLHPGIVVFPMNNISTHISMGIGGISYNKTSYIRDGVTIGERDFSKANFKLDVLDISIGLTIHL